MTINKTANTSPQREVIAYIIGDKFLPAQELSFSDLLEFDEDELLGLAEAKRLLQFARRNYRAGDPHIVKLTLKIEVVEEENS